MEPDMKLVVGMGLVVLSLPAILTAWADNRAPRMGALLFLGGAGFVIWALRQKDGGYTWAQIPDVVYGAIGQILN